ncbi:uncharacterized protein [Watersipora subatra]|uniref:uncharacterized protein isoform X2 n=1 Tax=Watersipora subatra TaxID=2589382 RepID=UPI00355B23D5
MAANASLTAMPKPSVKSYRDTSYREKPATPNSPSGTSVTTVYDHMLSPSSPAEMEKKDDRLRNDLLDEICNDMGIDDSMDLDFDDLCYGQQRSGSAPGGQRFPTSSSEGRRPSATASSSYSTSDSLSAIAKLTHSIPNESTTSSEVDVKPRLSPDNSSVKQEPCEVEGEMTGSTNDTDQGKAAAAAGRLSMQKQLSDGSDSSDLKRKRETVVQDSPNDFSHAAMNIGTLGNQGNIGTLGNQGLAPLPQRCPSYDYSYQDDYVMEDMTAPDTMINFSELPQQPNYYQCPQTASDTLNLGFNMSLQPSAQPAFAPIIPPAHQHHQSQNLGRFAFGGMQQHPASDMPVSRSSPQLRSQQAGPMLAHLGESFQGYPGQQASPSTTLQAQHGHLQRSESFPGANHVESNQFQPSGPSTSPHTSKTAPVSAVSVTSTAAPVSTPHRSIPSSISSTAAGRSIAPNAATTQQDFLQQLISESSSAFRSHPLFPLLRDLIIADVNFCEKSFPHTLIVNLPSDFDKLLKNYLSRNPPKKDYQCMDSVESVLMDALKYAHHILIEKINKWKQIQERQQLGSSSQPIRNPDGMTATPIMNRLPGEYCDRGAKHDMAQAQASYARSQMNVTKPLTPATFRPPRRDSGPVYGGELGPPTPGSNYSQPLSVDTGSVGSPTSSRHSTPLASQPPSGMYTGGQAMPSQFPPQHTLAVSNHIPNPRNPYMTPQGGPPLPPPNYTVSPNNPPLSRHQQTLYEMGPPPSGPAVYNDPSTPYHDPYNNMPAPPAAHHHRLHHLGPTERHLLYLNNINDGSLVKTMMEGGKDMYDSMSDTASVMSSHSMQGSVKGQPQGQGKPTEGRKHASLPKEAVNIMLNWLREHQDKPYPNDDEKGMLIKQTGLSITQINYWFTNARRRLLPKWRGEDM